MKLEQIEEINSLLQARQKCFALLSYVDAKPGNRLVVGMTPDLATYMLSPVYFYASEIKPILNALIENAEKRLQELGVEL